jgi:hypothetical protein
MREWRSRIFEATERRVEVITELAEELRQRLDRARRALARGAHAREKDVDWADEMQRLTPQVHARIEARPRPRAFVIFTAALLLLALAPTLLALPSPSLAEVFWSGLLVLGGCAVVTWGVLARLRRDLHDETHRGMELAGELSKDIGERVERRKRHLETLCAVEVARRNYTEAQEAVDRAGRRMLLLKHHRDALDKHCTLAQAFAKHHAVGRRAPPVQPSDPGGTPSLAAGWRIELPPESNPVYAPALCTGSLHEQAYEVRIRAGARVIRCVSARVQGLKHLQLVDEIYYDPPGPKTDPTEGEQVR